MTYITTSYFRSFCGARIGVQALRRKDLLSEHVNLDCTERKICLRACYANGGSCHRWG